MKFQKIDLDVPATTSQEGNTHELAGTGISGLLIQIVGGDATYDIEGSLNGEDFVDITKCFFDMNAAGAVTPPLGRGIFALSNSFSVPPKYFRVKCAAQGTSPAKIYAQIADEHSF